MLTVKSNGDATPTIMEKANIEDVKKALQEMKESEQTSEEFSEEEEEKTPEPEETEESSTSGGKDSYEPTIPKYRLDEVIAQREEERKKREELERKLREKEVELEDIKQLSGEDVVEALEVKKEIKALKSHIANLQQKAELNEFLFSNPSAKKYADILTKFKAAEPHKSFQQIYKEVFEPLEATQKKKAKAETGRGSMTESFEGGMTPEKFRKLSLEQKREYLKKLGL